jgi:hypothetical protein
VHPSQDPTDGWIDVEGTLRTVLAANPECFINHEVYASLDTDPAKTREGIAWVESIWREATGMKGPPTPGQEERP